ncbi:hypothetical protein OH540_09200 [Streptomyces sp. BPPL-273]|uniref:hypothetical protein n=1 Tax=Streptomyces sp. BPPL-273 TaxID=2987533 RepID=UPI0024AF93F1|nr:hypothetical protein [Streptomyces sp. BPPL-273]WHM30197.1 hypothetical protein OH540_09200 [Streptomyces sp. BPPL-273]
MARLQILELPTGADDDRPPFILVIDQAPRDENSAAFRDDILNNEIAAHIGARHVLVFEDTIDIPANDTSGYLTPRDAGQELVVQLGDQDVSQLIDKVVRRNPHGDA